MQRQRLEFALERLGPGDWERFEEFASEYLSGEFSNLRTTATPSGDRGRDSEVILPQADPAVVLQYSVTEGWNSKIRKTVRRVKTEHPNAQILIYVTNQQIGAEADDLKREMMKDHRLFIDIRDRSWFLDRYRGDVHREATAEALAKEVVDPYLASRALIENKGVALSTLESRAALLYLGLQWEDDTREKGLTRISFEALVRSVLRNTDSHHRLSRGEVHRGVQEILPGHDPDQVRRYTDTALRRLAKQSIRHWSKEDEFCLSHEEKTRLNGRLAEVEAEEIALRQELTDRVSRHLEGSRNADEIDTVDLLDRCRRILERFLLSRGELFAAAVREGTYEQVGFGRLKEVVIQDYAEHPAKEKQAAQVDLIADIVDDLLSHPGDATQHRLRQLADSYTLMAFLQQTPDVQSAVSKMFAHGEIWLDATVTLPLFAELLWDEDRPFTRVISATSEAGIKVHVTWGVIEEIERHMNRSLACSRTSVSEWRGRIPYLYAQFVKAGGAIGTFGSWLDRFRGSNRPQDDISDFLLHEFGITTIDHDAFIEMAPPELRYAVQEIWLEAHEQRRQEHPDYYDPMLVQRLVRHDVENYVGVVVRRKGERNSPFGYTSWWLTIDRTAFEIRRKLRDRLSDPIPDSPVMSVDFLVNYLAFGPKRNAVSKSTEAALPIVLDSGLSEFVPPELIALAERVRAQATGMPEYVVSRMVRDALDKAKRTIGPIAKRGLNDE